MSARSLALLLAGVLVAGCGAELDQAPDEAIESVDDSTFSPTAVVSTTLYYEGSCAFLRRCSGGAGSMGKTYCAGYYTCSDTTPWVARPTSVSTSKCGGTARICKGTRCVSAYIRDTSCCGKWEGNPAVMKALGIGHGDGSSSGCAGYGQASVSVSY